MTKTSASAAPSRVPTVSDRINLLRRQIAALQSEIVALGGDATALPVWDCLRCQHQWRATTTTVPKQCPKCRTPYWDRPRGQSQARRGSEQVPEVRGGRVDAAMGVATAEVKTEVAVTGRRPQPTPEPIAAAPRTPVPPPNVLGLGAVDAADADYAAGVIPLPPAPEPTYHPAERAQLTEERAIEEYTSQRNAIERENADDIADANDSADADTEDSDDAVLAAAEDDAASDETSVVVEDVTRSARSADAD